MAVKFHQEIQINASPERVWSVLTDPKTWPRWFPELDEVTNLAAIKPGSTFKWRHGGDTGAGSIASVDPSANRLEVITEGGSSPVTHTFDVDRAGGVLGMGGHDTRLKYTMEYDPPGGALMDFVASGNPMDQVKVKHTLEKVRDLAQVG
jgi:uncharacterized protein YndB with AHSA1/START domain